MNALNLLRRRLTEMVSSPPAASVVYRVPGIWVEPEEPLGTVLEMAPASFWLGAVDRILAEPRVPISAEPPEVWTCRARVYNLFVRATAAFDHDGDGMVSVCNTDGVRETGSFAKAIALLPYIRSLGCNTVHLLPVYAIGVDGRKGALGSPYGVRDPFALDPTLAEPSIGLGAAEEFRAFVEAAHWLGLRVVIEFVFRTASKDSVWAADHPEWFYWIRDDVRDRSTGSMDETAYGSPIFLPGELSMLKVRVAAGQWEDLPSPHRAHQAMFVEPPAPDRVRLEDSRWHGTTGDGTVARIPGAFADWPPDDTQPPWDDVTYLRLYDHPDFNYIAYNTVRMYDARLAAPERAVTSLWERIAGILPHYSKEYGVDGVMVDMGHALPRQLKSQIVEAVRADDPGFAFWDEDFAIPTRRSDEAHDAVIGNLWWAVHRPAALRDGLLRQLGKQGVALPFFATPETHNTPRSAARSGGARRSGFAWTFGCFLPAIPFIHSGFELAETAPVNTGLDFTSEDAARIPVKHLGLYSAVAYDWGREGHLIDLIRSTLRLRETYESLLTDPSPKRFHIISPESGPALAYVRGRLGPGVWVIGNPTGHGVKAEFRNLPLSDAEVRDPINHRRLEIRGRQTEIVLAPWECLVFPVDVSSGSVAAR